MVDDYDDYNAFARRIWGQPLENIFETRTVERAPGQLLLDDPIPGTVTVLHAEIAFPCTFMIRHDYLVALREIFGKVHRESTSREGTQADQAPISVQDMFDAELLVRPMEADMTYKEWLQTPPSLQDIKDANLFTSITSTPSPRSSMIISGTPGIGKTLFLWFLVALRSSAKLPTVLQIDNDCYHYFSGGDDGLGEATQIFLAQETSLTGFSYRRRLGNQCWWLVDSGATAPPTAILNSVIPIILAASPRERQVDWASKRPTDTFFMTTWSLVELICARMLQKKGQAANEDEMVAYLRDHVASARFFFDNRDRLPSFKQDIRACLQQLTKAGLQAHQRGGKTSAEEFSHRVFTLVPQRDRLAPPVLVIPTPFLRECVEGALARRGENDLQYRDYFSLCCTTPLFSTIAGAILEDRMHRYYPLGGTCTIFGANESMGTKNTDFTYCAGLTSRSETIGIRATHEFRKLDPQELKLRDGIYYRPVSSNFPILDAFTYDTSTKTVTLLQSTMAPKHDLKASPLLTLRDQFGVKNVRCVIWTPLTHDTVTISVASSLKSLVKTVEYLKVDLDKLQRHAHTMAKKARFFD